jgi:hypothetical protein
MNDIEIIREKTGMMNLDEKDVPDKIVFMQNARQDERTKSIEGEHRIIKEIEELKTTLIGATHRFWLCSKCKGWHYGEDYQCPMKKLESTNANLVRISSMGAKAKDAKIDELEIENAELRKQKNDVGEELLEETRRCIEAEEQIDKFKSRWEKLKELPRWSAGRIPNLDQAIMTMRPTGEYIEFKDMQELESKDGCEILLPRDAERISTDESMHTPKPEPKCHKCGVGLIFDEKNGWLCPNDLCDVGYDVKPMSENVRCAKCGKDFINEYRETQKIKHFTTCPSCRSNQAKMNQKGMPMPCKEFKSYYDVHPCNQGTKVMCGTIDPWTTKKWFCKKHESKEI